MISIVVKDKFIFQQCNHDNHITLLDYEQQPRFHNSIYVATQFFI